MNEFTSYQHPNIPVIAEHMRDYETSTGRVWLNVKGPARGVVRFCRNYLRYYPLRSGYATKIDLRRTCFGEANAVIERGKNAD
jgi:hypothetical protein